MLFAAEIEIYLATAEILIQTEILHGMCRRRMLQDGITYQRSANAAAGNLIRCGQLVQLQMDMRGNPIPLAQLFKPMTGIISGAQGEEGNVRKGRQGDTRRGSPVCRSIRMIDVQLIAFQTAVRQQCPGHNQQEIFRKQIPLFIGIIGKIIIFQYNIQCTCIQCLQ